MKKFVHLHQILLGRGVLSPRQVIEPSLVDIPNLCSVHTPRYATAVWNGSLSRKEERRMGLPWSKSLAIRSRLAVQGTINAGLMALRDGISGNLAGGTHHAMPDLGEGFCVYNDVAVAIRVLQQAMWVKKVLVIDCDVHQGNGTAVIFENDPDVFTFSMHGEKNYPFKKPPSTLDVGLPDQTKDVNYINKLTDALDTIYSRFRPDLIFYLAGVDPLKSDHFGRLSLTKRGIRDRDYEVISSAVERDIPITLLLSGGYSPSELETAENHAILYETAAEIYSSRFN
ncbi:histone deacetylase [Rhodohalobacter sp.]|uniref:histone deacetylase family protein n=1 Tax=Rhodohalobacter sp. TaxID=1974210 RepID=UPI003564F230